MAKKDRVPPKSVQQNAKEGLELRKENNRGGLSRQEASKEGIGSGVQRATNLSNGDNISDETVKRMKAYFDRHQSDNLNEDGKNGKKLSNGYIAWQLWGGDEGRQWAEKEVARLKKEEEKKKDNK